MCICEAHERMRQGLLCHGQNYLYQEANRQFAIMSFKVMFQRSNNEQYTPVNSIFFVQGIRQLPGMPFQQTTPSHALGPPPNETSTTWGVHPLSSSKGARSRARPVPWPSVSASHWWYLSRSLSWGATPRQSPRQKIRYASAPYCPMPCSSSGSRHCVSIHAQAYSQVFTLACRLHAGHTLPSAMHRKGSDASGMLSNLAYAQ